MFQLTGTVGGKTYEENDISAKELLGIFSIDENIFSGRVNFKLHKSMVKKDRLTGAEKFNRKRSYKTTIEGTHKGHSIFVRYYSQKVRKSKDEISYKPERLYCKGKKFSKDSSRQFEEAVFFYIHPSNAKSPLRRDRQRISYIHFDPKLDAVATLALMATEDEIKREILAMDDYSALRVAKGITVKSQSIQISAYTSAEEAKLSLVKLLQKNPSEFEKSYRSIRTIVVGMVKDAIDRGFVYNKINTQGMHVWYWSGTEDAICTVQRGVAQIDGLILHASKKTVYEGFRNKINSLITSTQLDANAEELEKLNQ